MKKKITVFSHILRNVAQDDRRTLFITLFANYVQSVLKNMKKHWNNMIKQHDKNMKKHFFLTHFEDRRVKSLKNTVI